MIVETVIGCEKGDVGKKIIRNFTQENAVLDNAVKVYNNTWILNKEKF